MALPELVPLVPRVFSVHKSFLADARCYPPHRYSSCTLGLTRRLMLGRRSFCKRKSSAHPSTFQHLVLIQLANPPTHALRQPRSLSTSTLAVTCLSASAVLCLSRFSLSRAHSSRPHHAPGPPQNLSPVSRDLLD